MTDRNNKRIAFYTLGCKLNFSETASLSELFAKKGYQVVSFSQQADVYLINSCTVTAVADRKSRKVIKQALKHKPTCKVVVTGCSAQLRAHELKQLEGIDLIVGAQQKRQLPELIDRLLAENTPKERVLHSDFKNITDFFPAASHHGRTRSFLKVQDGCNYFCSYCTVPLARGQSRSPSVATLAEQCRQIAQKDVKEVVLTGVNIGDFGRHTDENFMDLLQALMQIEQIPRFRLGSVEPDLLNEAIIDFVTQNPRFQAHFHIPLQSGSNHILGLMRRRYKRELFAERVAYIRKLLPDAFIGVDVIVGFPGERDELFDESYQFIENLNVSALHVFSYSQRPNTLAATMPDQQKTETIEQRSRLLHQLSDSKEADFYQQQKGKTAQVLFENSRQGDYITGLTGNYLRVRHPYRNDLPNRIVSCKLNQLPEPTRFEAKLL